MAYKTTGKIIFVGDIQEKGKYQVREFWIKEQDQFPQDLRFELFGDKVGLLSKTDIDEDVDIQFNIKGKVYTDKTGVQKLFNTNSVWKINKVGFQTTSPNTKAAVTSDDTDDLAF